MKTKPNKTEAWFRLRLNPGSGHSQEMDPACSTSPGACMELEMTSQQTAAPNCRTFFVCLSSPIISNDVRHYCRPTTERQMRNRSLTCRRRIGDITWWHHDKIL